ncbi:hypothetical protein, partial [Paraburkholderia sabiae]|uniref:hypothetical protein n=1 Tax=Paraburkholderia sabiae TaxID=273251 RepID=UPI003F49812E
MGVFLPIFVVLDLTADRVIPPPYSFTRTGFGRLAAVWSTGINLIKLRAASDAGSRSAGVVRAALRSLR